MYRKTHTTMQLECKRKKCAAMRAAKERKRIDRAESMRDDRQEDIMGDRKMKPELIRLPDDCLTHHGCPRCGGERITGRGTHVETPCQHYGLLRGQLPARIDDDDYPTLVIRGGGIKPKHKVYGGSI